MTDENKPPKTAASETDEKKEDHANIERIGIDTSDRNSTASKLPQIGVLKSSTLGRLNSLAADISPRSALAETVERMSSMQKTIEAALGGSTYKSALQKAAEDLSGANNIIDSYRLDPLLRDIKPTIQPMPRIDLPPNPIHETNERLENIEERFEQMHQLAHEAAAVANSLNTSVAELLVGFKGAAESNAKSAKIAMIIGVVAIFISTASTAIPIIYDAVWVVDREKTAEAENAHIFGHVIKENTKALNKVSDSVQNSETLNRVLTKRVEDLSKKLNLDKNNNNKPSLQKN